MDSNNEVCGLQVEGPGTMYLRGYQIFGVPTSGGVPDDSYFALTLEGVKATYPFVNKHNLKGVTLPLKATNTDVSYDNGTMPAPYFRLTNSGSIKQATIRLASPTTNSPTFTKAHFQFIYIPDK